MGLCSVKPYEGNEKYIFISYCHKDESEVFPIIEQLNKEGYRIWFDEGIMPGEEWPEVIAEHLEAADVCIAFLSQSSLESHNCKREINFAVLKNKKFISIVLEKIQLSLGMEMQLQSYQMIKYYELVDRTELYRKINDSHSIDECQIEQEKTAEIFHDKRDAQGNTADNEEISQNPGLTLLRKSTGEVLPINKEMVIGRDSDRSDYAIPEQLGISGVHAFLSKSAEGLSIKDMNSTNGTFINGNKMNPGIDIELSIGDIVTISKEVFVVVEDENISSKDKDTSLKGKKFSLKIIGGNKSISITRETFMIGASEEYCDAIITDDQRISRKHLLVEIVDGKMMITDFHSTNGVYLNGARINVDFRTEVVQGDIIRIGRTELCVGIEMS